MAVQYKSIREWREQYARRILNIDFKPLSDSPFRASVVPIFDDLRIMRTAINPGVTFRDEELVRDGDDSYWLMIAQSTCTGCWRHPERLLANVSTNCGCSKRSCC
jgi:hypothetical protein